jgi:hypothetical protein
VRYAALLRGTESAWQAVSYGTSSIPIMARVGSVYLNFALWAVSIIPAWTVVKHFGNAQNDLEGDETSTPSSGDVNAKDSTAIISSKQ